MFTLERLFQGQITTMEIPMDIHEFAAAEQDWIRGALIQNAFPTLDRDTCEFIMSGMTPEIWDSLFGSDEENYAEDTLLADLQYHGLI